MTVRTITARRPGTCPQCGLSITTGEAISPVGRGRRADWGHTACAEQAARDLRADDLDAMTMGYGA